MGVLFDAPSFLIGFSHQDISTLREEALAAWAPPLHRAYVQDLPVLHRRLVDAQGGLLDALPPGDE